MPFSSAYSGAAAAQRSAVPQFTGIGVAGDAVAEAIGRRRKRAAEVRASAMQAQESRSKAIREADLLDQTYPHRERTAPFGALSESRQAIGAHAEQLAERERDLRSEVGPDIVDFETRPEFIGAPRPEVDEIQGIEAARPGLADVLGRLDEDTAAATPYGEMVRQRASQPVPATMAEILEDQRQFGDLAGRLGAERTRLEGAVKTATDWRPRMQADYANFGRQMGVAMETLAGVPKFEAIAERVMSANATGADDLALIFAAMKVLDPGVAVQGNDVTNVRNASGAMEALRGMWNYVIGAGTLGPAARRDMVQMVQSQIDPTIRQAKAIDAAFQRDVLGQFNSRNGTDLRIEEIRPAAAFDPYAEIAGVTRAQIGRQAASPAEPAKSREQREAVDAARGARSTLDEYRRGGGR